MSTTLKRYRATESAVVVKAMPINLDGPADGQASKPRRVNNRIIESPSTPEAYPNRKRPAAPATQSTYHSSQPPVSKDSDKLQRRTVSSTLPIRRKWENEDIIVLSDGEECEPVSSTQKLQRTPSEGHNARARRMPGMPGYNMGFSTSKPITPPKKKPAMSTAPAVQPVSRKAKVRSPRYQGQQGPQLPWEKVVGYWIPHEEEAEPSAPKPEDKGMVVPGDSEFPDYGGFEIGPEDEDVVYYCGPAFWRRSEEDEANHQKWVTFQKG
jgi:hypothetical protein